MARFLLSQLPPFNPIGPDVYFKHFKKLRFLKKIISIFSHSSTKCKQFQFEKPSSIEFDMPIHKRLAINLLLRVGQKKPPHPPPSPLGLIGLTSTSLKAGVSFLPRV